MKALLYRQYGGPEVLRWHDVAIPEPGPDEVMVAVKATSINPTDIKLRNGQLKSGDDTLPRTMGMDFSGIVAKTGPEVTTVKVGDKVAGYTGPKGGGFADYVIAAGTNVFLMPPSTTYEEACCLPMSAATAWVVSNDYVQPGPGKEVLVNGAGGGIGSFLLQLAKIAGAKVTGTAHGAEHLELLKELGADEVIDFRETDVLSAGRKYDAIVDTSGKMDFEQARHILKDNGAFSTMVPKSDPNKPGRADGQKKEKLVFAVPGPKAFKAVESLAGAGDLKVVVGKVYPLPEAVNALREFENGKNYVAGKVVLQKQPW